MIMANLFRAGNQLGCCLGVKAEASVPACAPASYSSRAPGRHRDLGKIRRKDLAKPIIQLVDNCPAGLQWRVPNKDNIHKRARCLTCSDSFVKAIHE